MLACAVIISIIAWAVFLGCVRSSGWKEVAPTGVTINFSSKMGIKYSFILTIIAGIFAGAGIALTAFAPGKNQ